MLKCVFSIRSPEPPGRVHPPVDDAVEADCRATGVADGIVRPLTELAAVLVVDAVKAAGANEVTLRLWIAMKDCRLYLDMKTSVKLGSHCFCSKMLSIISFGLGGNTAGTF